MKIEKIEDVLHLEVDKLKITEAKKALTKIRQLVKLAAQLEKEAEVSSEESVQEIRKDYPYKGVSYIKGKYVEIGLDLDNNEAGILEVKSDAHGRGFMMASNAIVQLEKLIKKQK